MRHIVSEIDFKQLDAKWQKFWKESGLYWTPEMPKPDWTFYLLEMFAYPSGDIHIGHVFNDVFKETAQSINWVIYDISSKPPVLHGKEETDRAHHRSAGDSCHLGGPGSAERSTDPGAGPVASLTGCREESRFDLPVPLRPGQGSGTYSIPYQRVWSQIRLDFGFESGRIATLFSPHLLGDRMQNV